MLTFAMRGVSGLLTLALMQTTCTTVIAPPDGPPDGTPATQITVRFVNQTLSALDVEFYASSQALGDPEAVLFLDGNRITAEIGFAGTGLIPAFQSDEILVNCDGARSIGTRGGRFVNSDTGVETGRGQQRVASLDLQYTCGDLVTITYSGAGDTRLAFE